jgi:DNA-binding beta-propeller fold protein YncE
LTHTIPAGNSVWSIAALGNELFVAAQCGMKVAVYDTLTFQQTRQIEIQNCEARGLATCSTNSCLYVSDWHANNVHKVSLASYAVTASWSAAARPAALSVNRSHNLLVACNISSKIQEYSSDGSLIREISVSSRPWQAVERNDGSLCVTTQGPVRGVFVLSIDGEVIHSNQSTTEGCGKSLMRRPCSLAANDEGFVLVADHDDNKILVLNPTLTDACELPLLPETITKPFSLYLDASCGKFYVGEFNTEKSRIQIFNNVFKINPF